jgi:hypothetical protein
MLRSSFVVSLAQVLEASWTELHRCLKEEVKDLDGVLQAHGYYLETILDKAFLSEKGYAVHSALQTVSHLISPDGNII